MRNRRMKLTPRVLLVLLATVSSLGAAAITHGAPSAEGAWSGAIELPGTELAIVVTLAVTDETPSGAIDIPAQGLKGFALSAVGIDGTRVHFEMAGIPGQPRFEGTLSDSGDSISGTFRQGSQSFPFILRRSPDVKADTAPAADTAKERDTSQSDRLLGDWLGTLDTGSMKLRLGLQVMRTAEGELRAMLDSVDQGSKLPVGEMEVDGSNVRLTLPRIGASFEGTLREDASAIDGSWSQGGQALPLVFERQAKAFSLNRPQHPEGPFPYATRDVTFQSESGGVRLAGTLTIPEGEGPFPAVAMVSGSGAQDRDESLMGHKPFLVIADFLARRGIASLRFDDRGAGKSEGDHFDSSIYDFAGDARAAIAVLRATPDVNPAAVGILGHSEGGLIAPLVAVGNDSVAFLVLLAPPGEPMTELLARQARELFRVRNMEGDLVERALKSHRADLALIASTSLTDGELRTRLRARANAGEFTPGERASLGIPDGAAIDQSLDLATSTWFRSLTRHDPSIYLTAVKAPVLALFAEKDIQVDARVNAESVRAALGAGGNSTFNVEILSGLNHLFQHAETGMLDEYGTIEETFAPEALDRIATWIEHHTKR